MPIQRVLAAIEEIKKGNMVIMMDDEDRENEGDLVFAAAFSTPEKINFMASRAKGLICVSLTAKDAERMDLQPMVVRNSSTHETAFTVSVDAMTAETGISAFERHDAVRLLADINSVPDDFARPGHIFPLIAKEGGVLMRTGHTEGSIDLCKLAGVHPCGVICEIMKEDGTMARKPDLEMFAKEYGLKIIYVSDIIAYRLTKEKLLTQTHSLDSSFMGIKTVRKEYTDTYGKTHSAFIFGELREHMNVRFMNISSDVESLSNPVKYASLVKSVSLLSQEGGVLIFLDTRQTDTSAVKEFGIGAQIATSLGIKKINLLTHTKNREFVGLSGFGLCIEKRVEL